MVSKELIENTPYVPKYNHPFDKKKKTVPKYKPIFKLQDTFIVSFPNKPQLIPISVLEYEKSRLTLYIYKGYFRYIYTKGILGE